MFEDINLSSGENIKKVEKIYVAKQYDKVLGFYDFSMSARYYAMQTGRKK